MAVLLLEPPEKGDLRVVVQPTFVDPAGKTVYGEPKELHLAARGGPPVAGPVNPPPVNPPPVNPFPPAKPARGPATGEELTKLLADLKSKDAADRQLAAELLAQSPPKERQKDVAAAVRGTLGDTEPAIRTAAAKVLAAVDPKEAAPALAKLLDDKDAGVRGAVLKLLKELKDARVAEAVAARLPTDPLPAIEVLKAMGPAAEKAVLPYLDDKYAGTTRFWAFNVIKEIGTAASLPALNAVQGGDRFHVKGVIQAVGERVPLTKDESAQCPGRTSSRPTRPCGLGPRAASPPRRRSRSAAPTWYRGWSWR